MPLTPTDLPGQVVKNPRIKITSIDPPRIQPGQKTTVTVQITNPNDFDVNCSCDYQVYANLWEYSFGPLTEKHLCSETLKAGETVTKQFQPPAVTNGPNYVRVICQFSAERNGVKWYSPPTSSLPGAFVVGSGTPSPMLLARFKLLSSSQCNNACLMAKIGYTLINTSAEEEIHADEIGGEILPLPVFPPEKFIISSNVTVEPLSSISASKTIQFHTFGHFAFTTYMKGQYYGKSIMLEGRPEHLITMSNPPPGHNWDAEWNVGAKGSQAYVTMSLKNTGEIPITDATAYVRFWRWTTTSPFYVIQHWVKEDLGAIQPGGGVSRTIPLPTDKYLIPDRNSTTFKVDFGIEMKFADGLNIRVPMGEKEVTVTKQNSTSGGGSGSNNSPGNTQTSPAPVVAEQDTVKVLAGTTIAGIILYELMKGGGKT